LPLPFTGRLFFGARGFVNLEIAGSGGTAFRAVRIYATKCTSLRSLAERRGTPFRRYRDIQIHKPTRTEK